MNIVTDVETLLGLHKQAEAVQAELLDSGIHEPLDDDDLAAHATAASQPLPPAAQGLLGAAAAAPGTVAELLAVANDPRQFALAQRTAAHQLKGYPHNGCADFALTIARAAGFHFPALYLARALGLWMEGHGWKSIPVDQIRPGDYGSTCGAAPHPGVDHIFLIMEVHPGGRMRVGDNQRPTPHERWVVGHGKSPMTHALRLVA